MGIHKSHMSGKLRTKQINHMAVHRATPSDQLHSGHKFMLCLPPYTTLSAVRRTRCFFVAILVAGYSFRCHQASQQRRTCPCIVTFRSGAICTGYVMHCHPPLLGGNTASTCAISRTIYHERCPIHYYAHYT